MKVHLLYEDLDFDLGRTLLFHSEDLVRDLGLDSLFHAMAKEDEFLYKIVQKVVLSSENDLKAITYRQEILKDCIENQSIVKEIYTIAVETIESRKRNHFGIFTRYPSSILSESLKMLCLFIDALVQLRDIAKKYKSQFHASGFISLFDMLLTELTDEYFDIIVEHLRNLALRDGALISVRLGKGNRGVDYTLVKPPSRDRGLIGRIFGKKTASFTFRISDRDETGARTLSELNDRGLNQAANALAQSADHILNFFSQLKMELAFYISCLNLYEWLTAKGEPVCFPLPIADKEHKYFFRGLYDISLSLNMDKKVVGNDLEADGKALLIITGANQGGKSTFLRSIGIAQLMMQCGMFTPALSFCANICNGLFTHFRREEDADMNSGKFDEELSRMSTIADHIAPNSMILFNESFAATNEREGSEIAKQVTRALLDSHIKVVFVTHMYEFANEFYGEKIPNTIFLRANREDDGTRTFKITQGRPLATSHGQDLYDKIFPESGISPS